MTRELPFVNLNPVIPFAGTVVEMTTKVIKLSATTHGLTTKYIVENVKHSLTPGESFNIEGISYTFADLNNGTWSVVIEED